MRALRVLVVMASAAGGLCGCRGGTARASSPPAEAALPGHVPIRLLEPPPGRQWALPAGDNANTRYSSLDQINATNAKHLRIVGMTATGVARGHEGQPLAVDDTLFVVTPFPNDLIALDLKNLQGPIKWKYQPYPNPASQGKACCDLVNRGASFSGGKVVYNLLDGNTVAVDARTGKELWRTKVGDISRGETLTMAPLVVKNHVIVGNSGGEMGVRGFVAALDLASGKQAWRGYNTGPDSEVLIGQSYRPFYGEDRGKDLGVKTWPPEKWKNGGATVWGWISYDPHLNLIYYGTANPSPWNADARPGDNKWSCAIIARDADSGQVRWAHQLVPHDEWDYDEIIENILVDMEWEGRPRKLLLHAGRVGFMFVMDRETGEMLAADKFVGANWASAYDLKTGRPVRAADKATHEGKLVKDICPSSTGGKEFVPAAVSPRTGYLYIPAHHTCMEYRGTPANYIAGTPYLGASVKMYPGKKEDGELIAWDVAGRRKVWSRSEKFPVYSGVLVTAGDIVFYGTMDGWFRALDARDGTELWSMKLPSGVIGNPMTFQGPDGKQYVAIYSGVGGWMGVAAFDDVSADDPYAALGTVGAMRELKKYTGAGDVVVVLGL